jgi:2-amino-4-hydroxy-6-hydroxymethyldihydropteridine diphosphokinase
MPIANIGIGSNIGDAAANVLRAIEELKQIGTILSQSSLYRTKPWGVKEQDDFCNAVVQVKTNLDPQALLTSVQQIEKAMGRTETYRWGPRIIDLDILTVDKETVREENLQIPHPHMLERAFVLIPLAEIDPSYKAALNKLSTEQLAEVELWDRATFK